MTVSLRVLHTMIDLWERRDEPEGPDVPRALHAARTLEADRDAPAHLRGFAWNLATEIHRAAGWQIPDTESLPLCRSAATSISHSAALVLDDIAAEIAEFNHPVLVLGALAASRSLFGRWDLLPARGALLVPLVRPVDEDSVVDTLPSHDGIRWGRAGGLLETLQSQSREVVLDGLTVRVPAETLIAARPANVPGAPGDMHSLLICAAARRAASRGTWEAAQLVAKSLGRQSALHDSAIRCGLDDWLGLQIPRSSRLAARLRELLLPGQRGRPL